jgi:hypothetical protein
VLLHDVLYLLVAFAILQSFMRRVGAPVGGLLEEIQYEAAGLPRWTPSAVNVLILFSGLFGLSTVAGSILASALSGIAPTVAILDPLLSGVAFAGWKIGEYIARTNPSGPNGKPRRSEA